MLRSAHSSNDSRWPTPYFNNKKQPHFLFLITPPYSGSTAIANILNTSPKIMTLTPHGEGQWIVPGLCEKDRWDPKKEVDYESVKAVWLNEFQEKLKSTPNIDVVIEKSPPNMMRIAKLSSQFDDFSFLTNNRNPYAFCVSSLYRNSDPENISKTKRKELLEELALSWIIRSRKIQESIIEYNIPLLTYEKFCQNPRSILKLLRLPEGVVDTIDLNAVIKVKDYKAQSIANQNERQTSNLTNDDFDCISDVLDKDSALLDYFGYQIR
jgi:hypothetical protein